MTAFTRHAKGAVAFLLVALLILPLGNAAFAASPDEGYTPQVRAINANDTSGVTMSPFMGHSELLEYMLYEKGIDTFGVRTLPQSGRGDDVYRVLSVALPVEGHPSFTPTLDIYCQVSVGDGVWGIMNVFYAQVHSDMIFAGNVYLHLRSAERVEYIVNGSFCRGGTDTSTQDGGLLLCVGDGADIAFNRQPAAVGPAYAYCYSNGIKKVA